MIYECNNEHKSLSTVTGMYIYTTQLNFILPVFQYLVYKKLQKEAEFQRQEWIKKQGKNRQ